MKQRIITPLSEFPTEAIVHLFKKNRHCVVNRPFDSWYKGYNKETKQHEYWVPFRGGYDETSKVYDSNIIGYTLMSSKEIAEKYNTRVLAKLPIDPELAAKIDKGQIEAFEGDYLDSAADTLDEILK